MFAEPVFPFLATPASLLVGALAGGFLLMAAGVLVLVGVCVGWRIGRGKTPLPTRAEVAAAWERPEPPPEKEPPRPLPRLRA
jgi:hypothetical protein